MASINLSNAHDSRALTDRRHPDDGRHCCSGALAYTPAEMDLDVHLFSWTGNNRLGCARLRDDEGSRSSITSVR